MTANQTTSNPGEPALSPIAAFQSRIAGELILPGDGQYHGARQSKSLIRNRFPSIIVQPANTGDVAESVKFARRNSLPISVRGGGHSIPGYSVIDGTLLIDLSKMTSATIDPERQMARVQGGALSRDLAIPAHEHGLALSTGDTGSVGLGGLVTGGGVGWFVRKYGLAIDRLRSAQVVTANGDVLTASPVENADLFWAIRGGGGNFGIVTEYEFELVPVKYVYGGAIVLPATRDVVREYLEYVPAAPDELTTMATITHAPPAPFIPEELVGTKVLLILVAWLGDEESGQAALAPLRALAEPIADTVATIPYPGMFQYMEWAEAPHGASIRMMFADEIPDATIDDFIDAVDNATSPFAGVHLRGLGGELARQPLDSTAFVHREAKYFVAVLGVWFDADDDVAVHQNWTTTLWDKISHLRKGVYVNFLDDEGDARVREAYPDLVYRRLAEVKAKYDPENVFKHNQNVRPAKAAQEAAA